MTGGSNKMISDFARKPKTESFFASIAAYTRDVAISVNLRWGFQRCRHT